MNYRHAFHAGNFADLIKHAAIILVMDRLAALAEPLLVLDSHAGAGVYRLDGPMARKSGEARAGILQLMADEDAPAAFRPLKAAVLNVNRAGAVTVYPGSPMLIADRLRRDDEYVGAELRSDDFETLSHALAGSRGRARAMHADGYALVRSRAADRRRLLALIDPPFEEPGDYGRIVEAVTPVLARRKLACVVIWLPLKDLETFDGFLRRLEMLEPSNVLVVETRLRPLDDPMTMNGCALVILGPPPGLEPELQAAADWTVAHAGGTGGLAKLWRLTG